MGNKSSQILRKKHHHHGDENHENSSSRSSEGIPGSNSENDGLDGEHHVNISKKKSRQYQTAALQKLFQKLELTSDGDNNHPGELTKTTFENAFHGPLHKFGKLLYIQMMASSTSSNRERIAREQFVKAGKEILKLYEDKNVVKYYFQLFSAGKDYLTREDARQMFEMSFALTLSESKILYQMDERDSRLFNAMVEGVFGIRTEVHFEDFSKWVGESCPHLYHGVHNWVTHVLTGSSLPEEMETARFPQLEGVTGSNNCTSMATLWLLCITLPPIYTRHDNPNRLSYPPAAADTAASAFPPAPIGDHGNGATRDPMWTSMLLLRKMARLPQVQSWKLLYSSDDHGMSINRFNIRVSAYNAPNITFFSFEGRNIYCLAVDRGWREGPEKFGGEDCRLIQLSPVYRVLQAGDKMVRWCESSRTLFNGIQIGREGQTEVLRLPQDFDTIHHYEVKCGINKIEVWGCGAVGALEAQEKQRKWEASAVRREQSRKLRPHTYGETWEDSPDKQLLQWGGVNVGNHSYNR